MMNNDAIPKEVDLSENTDDPPPDYKTGLVLYSRLFLMGNSFGPNYRFGKTAEIFSMLTRVFG